MQAVLAIETVGTCCRTCGSLLIVTFHRGPANLFTSGGTRTKGQGGAGAPTKVVTGSRWLSLENTHLEKGSRRVG